MWGYYAEVGSEQGYEDYVQRLVYGVKDWDEYLKVRKDLKPAGYFEKLQIEVVPSEPIYTGSRRTAK
jgi:hypothetical protein